jgi:hypothetical protein
MYLVVYKQNIESFSITIHKKLKTNTQKCTNKVFFTIQKLYTFTF